MKRGAWTPKVEIPSVLARLGGFALVHDPHGEASHFPGGMGFATNLTAIHSRRGRVHDVINLGSGLVTNVGVLALANDFNWASPSAAKVSTLTMAKNMFTGIGTTAAAATDYKIQTISAQGGQTVASAVTQSLVSAANSQKYQVVGTSTYTGSEAVTEWGLFTSATLTATTGTPATATSATSLTTTATPLTASTTTVQGQQLNIIEAGTTTVWGLVLSNTTSVFTIPAWYKDADGTAGSTPGSTEAYTIRPVMWDHKVFSALNVINGDTIVWTYQLTVNSGG